MDGQSNNAWDRGFIILDAHIDVEGAVATDRDHRPGFYVAS